MYYELMVFLILSGIGIISGKILIPFLRKLKFGQTIREEGPESHKAKTGTPTMGGLLFFVVFILGSIIFAPNNKEVWFMVIFSLAYGLIGFLDDYLIVVKKNNLGLTAKSKFLLLSIASILGTFYYLNVMGYSSNVGIQALGFSIDLGSFYYIFALLLLVGTTNAVNITDGVDGLSTTVTIVASLFFLVYSYIFKINSVMLFSIFILASCFAFLYYNWNPAKVFMGDTGSLFLGGTLAVAAMVTKTELLLPLVGGVYVLETLSVIAQVFSFKVFKKRIFKMSPIHHHFELSGWKEKKIVFVFSGTGAVFLIISLMLI